MGSHREQPSYVAPERLYTLRGLQAASGISSTRMRQAKRQGIECPMLEVGKRKFIRGFDAIAYIERLAASDLDLGQRES